MRSFFNPSKGLATVALFAGLAASASTALASLTLLPLGPQLGTHAGNLVSGGSFEAGPASALVYWATGTAGSPFAVPPGLDVLGRGYQLCPVGTQLHVALPPRRFRAHPRWRQGLVLRQRPGRAGQCRAHFQPQW